MIGHRRNSARGTRFEVSTNTRDASLQLVFSDPSGALTQLGIAIPKAVPTDSATAWENRYLIQLVSVSFAEGERARLVGMRQRLLIGQLLGSTPAVPVYTDVKTPDWHFTDGNVSWHLRRLSLEDTFVPNVNNAAEQMFRTSGGPALLFEQDPVTGYTPPNGGKPPGNAVIPEFGTFHDLRFPWQDDEAWDSLDVEIEGPCRIVLYVSVRQSDPVTRPSLNLNQEGLSTDAINVILPEERFIQSFTNAIYTRVAGSLIFEGANFYPEPYEITDPVPSYAFKEGCAPSTPSAAEPPPEKKAPPSLPPKGRST